MKPSLLLVGLGDLGGVLLEFLAREPALGRIIVASRNEARGRARCNQVRLGALAQGYTPSIDFTPLDLDQLDVVAETVRRWAPDIILTTATKQTWWLTGRLPPVQAELIEQAGFGVWLPVHLTLTLKLMTALRRADYRGLVLTAPFPDVVNPILGRLGLAPTAGIGNLDEIVPKLQWLAAEQLDTTPKAVEVLLVAHHAMEAYTFAEVRPAGPIPPYYLRLTYQGQDVTDQVDGAGLLTAPYPIPVGPVTHFLTAGSTLRLVRALCQTEPTRLHVPGPNGLPGGYPVLASQNGVRPMPLPDLSLAEAMTLNERSHRFDGIERIEADGTAIFMPESVQLMRQALGYNCPSLAPAEAEGRADELMARFREFARKHGVALPS